MSEEESGGGTVGQLWRKHGGGYYALLVIGTFLYLELTSLVGSIRDADGVQDFLLSEALSFLPSSPSSMPWRRPSGLSCGLDGWEPPRSTGP